jgi:hypothetical protein
MEEADRAALVLQLLLHVLDAGPALVEQGVAHERGRHDGQDEHGEDEHEGGAGPPQAGLDPGPDRVQADGEDGRPADLEQEGLDDPPHHPREEEEGAVERDPG